MSKATSTVKPRRRVAAYRPPYKFIEIVWDDAASNSDTWVAAAEVAEPEQVLTRGFLVKETDKYVCVAGSVANEEDHEAIVGNTITIPKGMIVERRELHLTTMRKREKKAPATDAQP